MSIWIIILIIFLIILFIGFIIFLLIRTVVIPILTPPSPPPGPPVCTKTSGPCSPLNDGTRIFYETCSDGTSKNIFVPDSTCNNVNPDCTTTEGPCNPNNDGTRQYTQSCKDKPDKVYYVQDTSCPKISPNQLCNIVEGNCNEDGTRQYTETCPDGTVKNRNIPDPTCKPQKQCIPPQNPIGFCYYINNCLCTLVPCTDGSTVQRCIPNNSCLSNPKSLNWKDGKSGTFLGTDISNSVVYGLNYSSLLPQNQIGPGGNPPFPYFIIENSTSTDINQTNSTIVLYKIPDLIDGYILGLCISAPGVSCGTGSNQDLIGNISRDSNNKVIYGSFSIVNGTISPYADNDVWRYNNGVLTDQNQSILLGILTDPSSNKKYLGALPYSSQTCNPNVIYWYLQ